MPTAADEEPKQALSTKAMLTITAWIVGITIASIVMGPFAPLLLVAAACIYWAPAKRAIKRSGWTFKDDGAEEAKAVKELRRTLDGGDAA